MKQNETLLNTADSDKLLFDLMGDDHTFTGIETPLRPGAFDVDDDTKVELIAQNFKEIMHILGLDLTTTA